DIMVEIQGWDRVSIHPDVGQAVDDTLRGRALTVETRWLDDAGEVKIEKVAPVTATRKTTDKKPPVRESTRQKLFLFGVNRGRFEQASREMQLGVDIVDSLKEANLFVTSKSHYRRKPQKVKDAEVANLPIYVLRSNTPSQIMQFLGSIYRSADVPETGEAPDSFQVALGEAQEAVNLVKNGQGEVELSPQSSYIRRLQHLVAERNQLDSQSTGKEPRRRVRIYQG
ncbi:MAG: R3H domain-containing nucleic acid-binding protein, partial [Dehalococcoidales bacterium]